jgi:signal peptidase I
MKISRPKKKKKSVKSKRHEWLKAILIAFILIILLNVFAFKSITVENSKMESTLFPGDFIIVNKLGVGARLPITLLSFPFIGNNLPFSQKKSYSDLIQLPYFRIPGFSKIKNNDLIVFNYPLEKDQPIDKKTTMISRCVGTPGDTLAIIDKKIFINNTNIPDPENCKFRYRVVSKNDLTTAFTNAYNINEGGLISQPNIYDFFITQSTSEQIRQDSLIKSVNLIKVRRGIKYTPFFPQSKYYGWSLDYFGPIIIPCKDKTIQIDIKTIDLYKKVIAEYEKNKVVIVNDTIYVNDQITKSYTFKMNYYFVLDDNRDNGKDSRYWGFIPEDHIIGKASFVWFSVGKQNQEKSFRWNRLFKIL